MGKRDYLSGLKFINKDKNIFIKFTFAAKLIGVKTSRVEGINTR
jgi:hypothetical protein